MDRQKEKERKRAEIRERKASAPPRTGDEDPDIAGIRPGPQPVPDWLREEHEENEEQEAQEEAADADH